METEEKDNILSLETEIVNILRNVYDPEIPVNIYDLGLIYDIDTDENKKVVITMTLTAPNCPVADILPNEIKEKVSALPGVSDVEINLVFDPPWNQSMMSEEALFELGML
ncbi:MAG TPA: SUF system Fe-S cluster assembly protein [Bacteroidales bacterium]|jgi:FeS assembly SUF system protein|nr:SUF system Fe-S cluster assembly protein [Bacteroidales bacterium]